MHSKNTNLAPGKQTVRSASGEKSNPFPEIRPLELGQLIFMTTTSLLEEYKDRLTEILPPPRSRELQRLVRELTGRFGDLALYWRTSRGRPLENFDRDLAIWRVRRQRGLSYGKIGIMFHITRNAAQAAFRRQTKRFEDQENQWKATCARMSLPYTPLFL